jgi:hypothetical protein
MILDVLTALGGGGQVTSRASLTASRIIWHSHRGYGVRRNPRWPLERATGIEPATSSLGSWLCCAVP